MTSGAEWLKLARAAQSAQHANQRRGSGRGRATPDRAGMVRARINPTKPDHPADENTPASQPTTRRPPMTDSHDDHQDQPDDLTDRAHSVAEQIRAEGNTPTAFEIAARLIEQTHPDDMSAQ